MEFTNKRNTRKNLNPQQPTLQLANNALPDNLRQQAPQSSIISMSVNPVPAANVAPTVPVQPQSKISLRNHTVDNDLVEGVRQNNLPAVEKLLEKGAKPGHANNLPLKLASILGFTDIVSKLLDYDVNPNVEDTDIIDTKFLNHTALMLAAEKGHADTVQVLLAKGADPNIRHDDGYTALTLASCNNAPHIDVINVLLEHGADPDVLPTDQYSSALFCATRSGNEDLVKTLLDKQADPNIQGLYDRTPLMWAALKGYTNIVQMLLENGAKVNISTNNKETALTFAQRGEQEAKRDTIVKMLQLYNPASRGSWSLPTLPHIFQPRQVLQHDLPNSPRSNKAYLPTRKNYRKKHYRQNKLRSTHRRR